MAKPREPVDRQQLLEAVGPLIQSLTRELDDDSPASTITRAVNICQHYAIPPRAAIDLVYQARATVKQRHHVRRKAPYLLTILEQLAREWEPDDDQPRYPYGNQNARKHGWWSRLAPPTDEELQRTIRELALAGQWGQLRELARAVAYSRGDRQLARHIRKLARQLERAHVLKAAGLLDRIRERLGEAATELVGEEHWQ
jgi:hypothetical protein